MHLCAYVRVGVPLQSFDHYLVYWVAPTVGGVVATVLFALLQAGFSAKDDKRKDD
jgi:glycerol uptake facilitator-like aquaporin